MTKIVKPLRPKRPVKRLDMAELRHLLRDRRMWTVLGVVTAPDDGGDHYEVHTNEAGKVVDITVEVVTRPVQIDLTCRLKGVGASAGVVSIPDVGDEVVVEIPDGEIDFMPSIVTVLHRAGVLEPGAQGPAPARVVICAAEVMIHDGSGGAEPLVRKSEFDGHTHGPGSFTTPSAGGGGGPVTGTSSGAAAVDGTSVLLGK